MATYPSLHGAAVLISGGGAGIGAAIVDAFAEQGARVFFVDRDAAAAATTADAILSRHGSVVAYEVCDLTDLPSSLEAVGRLERAAGGFRALVNNAGNDAAHAFDTVSPALFDERIAVNLRHHFFLAQAVAPGMAAGGGGAIVNLGSISWMIGVAGVSVYATAKAAVEGLTRALARELGSRAIRVNSVAPGWVLTERQLAKGAKHPEKFAEYLSRQAIKEHLEPRDVAELTIWLCADESRRCTGQTWIVDAGAS